jgi:hypothetical protein
VEVSGKGSLGPAWPVLVKVSNAKFEVEHKVSRLKRWVCRKTDEICSEMNIGRSIKCLRIYDGGSFIFVEFQGSWDQRDMLSNAKLQ